MKNVSLFTIAAMLLAGPAMAADAPTTPATQPARAVSQVQPGAVSSTGAASAAPPVHLSWSHFEVIALHDIFLRNGSSRGRDGSTSGGRGSLFANSANPAASSPAAWVLTGIALQSGDREAFLENSQTGETLRARAGQLVAGVRLVKVGMDGVELQADGVTRRIEVGLQLNGRAPASLYVAPEPSTSSYSSASSSTPTTTGPTTLAPGSHLSTESEASILERLKARRNQELSK